MPYDFIVSQAVDEKASFLLNPLNDDSYLRLALKPCIHDLIILTGNGSNSEHLATQLSHLVETRCESVRVTQSVSDLLHVAMTSKTTILSLVELEEPFFKDMSRESWEGLKKMVMTIEFMIWLTRGRRSRNPFANIMAGFMRSVVREIPSINYQILDVEHDWGLRPYVLAEALIRFHAGVIWQRQGSIHTSMENELAIGQNGRIFIPRLISNKEMNDRYNCSRRDIMKRNDLHGQIA